MNRLAVREIRAHFADPKEALERLEKGEPYEYIIGKIPFYNCEIALTRDVLIPRVETELLLEKVLARAKGKVAFDICCGSGCLGIAFKKERPDWEVYSSDLCEKACAVAKGNGATVLQGDLFAPFSGMKADLIMCNPPYISKKEYETLDRSVRDFEPEKALVGGEDGLEFYRRLSCEAFDYLNPGGLLALEIGYNQREALMQLFSSKGRVEKDLAGHDRFFFLEKESPFFLP